MQVLRYLISELEGKLAAFMIADSIPCEAFEEAHAIAATLGELIEPDADEDIAA